MDRSSYEAVILGVNVLIFVVALSTAMVLMGSVNEMVNFTREEAQSTSTGNIVETLNTDAERIFTGAEINAFYGKIKQNQLDAKNGASDSDYTVNLQIGTYNLVSYLEAYGINLKNEYKMEYKGKDGNGKEIYSFVPVT